MSALRLGRSQVGDVMHYSVGCIVRKPDGTICIVQRKRVPLGWACPAGHIERGETAKQSMYRELAEEIGLVGCFLKPEWEMEMQFNRCSRGIDTHYWLVFSTTAPQNFECSSADPALGVKQWLSRTQLLELALADKLEPIWKHWLTRAGLISA